MNFKKILVLLIALIMAVGACAPAIHAFNYANIEEKGEEAVEGIQTTIDELVAYVSENYVDIYAEGYNYARENGYIDAALNAVGGAIVAIENIDISGLAVGDDLKEALQYEIEACASTLGLVELALECEEFEWLAFVGIFIVFDIEWHIDNLRDIYAEVLVDESLLGLVDELENALDSVDAAINAALDRAYEGMVEALLPYYNYATFVVDMTMEAYETLVETIAMVHTTIVRVQQFVVDVNNTVVEVVENIKHTFEVVMDTYTAVVSTLVAHRAELTAAFTVALQVYEGVVDFVVEYKNDVKNAVANAKELYNDVVDMVVSAYGEGKDAVAIALEIYAYVTDLFAKVNTDIYETLFGAFNGNFVLNENSYYVALGNAPYADKLANMVHLGNKYDRFDIDGDYVGALAGADLITIDLTDDKVYEYAYAQVMGKLAAIVRGNDDLMGWYNDERFVGPYIREALEGYGIDINAEAVDLDWSKYLDEEGKKALDACLATVKQEVIANGVPEVYVLHFGDLVLDVLAQNGLTFPGVTITLDVEIPVADLVVFAIENVIYKHVEFTTNFVNALENAYTLAPNATVVVTGLTNPLGGISEIVADLGVDLGAGEIALEMVVGALNLQLLAGAFAYENVVYVPTQNAEDIFDAINFTCAHKFGVCEDLDCDLCGEAREAVPHVFTNYVFNNDSTCTKNGTETAVCDNCDKTDTREAANSKSGHDWANATCTAPKTCNECGKKEGPVMPHTYGEWKVLEEPTDLTLGVREHACTVCGHVEQEKIPTVQPEISVPAIIGIVVLVVAVVCGASAGFCYYKKRKEA